MFSLSQIEEKWNTTIDNEWNFLNHRIINIIINVTKECNNCKGAKIYISNGDYSILSPLISRCMTYKKNLSKTFYYI